MRIKTPVFPAPGCGRGVLALNSSLECFLEELAETTEANTTAIFSSRVRYTSLLPRIVPAVQITFVNTW